MFKNNAIGVREINDMNKNVNLANETLRVPYFLTEEGIHKRNYRRPGSAISKHEETRKTTITKTDLRIVKLSVRFISVSTILFLLGMWEHPETPFLSRLGAALVQSTLGCFLWSLVVENWDKIKKDLRYMLYAK